jgi:uncharacterized cupin superfamily protein
MRMVNTRVCTYAEYSSCVASEILLWAVKELFILARFGIAYEYVEPGEVSELCQRKELNS